MSRRLPLEAACLAAALASSAGAQTLRDRRERLKREIEAAIAAEQWDLARAKKREFDRLIGGDDRAPAVTEEPPTSTTHGYSIAQVRRDHPPLDPATEKKIRDILSSAPVPGVRQMRYAYFGALENDTMGPAASRYVVGGHALLVSDALIAGDPFLRERMAEPDIARFRERVLVHEAFHGLLLENEDRARSFLALPGGWKDREPVLVAARDEMEFARLWAEDRAAKEQGAEFYADYEQVTFDLVRAQDEWKNTFAFSLLNPEGGGESNADWNRLGPLTSWSFRRTIEAPPCACPHTSAW